jgi:ribosomal protein S5
LLKEKVASLTKIINESEEKVSGSNTKQNLLKAKMDSLEQENCLLTEQVKKEKEALKTVREELKNAKEELSSQT